LAVVRHLVEQHGGTVSAESDGLKQGSTFTVTLPITAVNLPAEGVQTESSHEIGGAKCAPFNGAPSLEGVRVLVVDDQPDARELLSVVLSFAGAEVTTAGSVVEALNTLVELKPDVLISDIGMPEHDGFTLINRLRSLPKDVGGAIPAIALTAYATEEDRIRSLKAGFRDHVAKPVEPGELISVVAKAAGGGAGRR
jgi:CheY-like chemotaxis protein